MKNVCREKVDSVALIISYYNLGFLLTLLSIGNGFWQRKGLKRININKIIFIFLPKFKKKLKITSK